MIENRISGYLYNELFSERNVEQYTAFQSLAWSLIVHKNAIKKLLNCSPTKYFPSGLSLRILYFLFHKVKNTSAIPQPSVQDLVYVFPIFFRFHKCFNHFHLNKNILINKFHRNVFLYSSFFSMTQGSCRFLSEVKYPHAIKNETFPLYSH